MRPTREPASPSALAPALLRWAAARSLDAGLVAARGGLDLADAEREEVPVTAGAVTSMFETLAELAADPHVALTLPRTLAFRRYDAGALAARVAATPRAALEAFARYAPLVFPRLEARVENTEAAVAFHATFAGAPRGHGHHVDEYVVALALHHCCRGDVTVHPRRVWLVSSRPHGELPAYGTTEIEFGAETTGVALERREADRTFPSFDPMLVAVADQIATAALAHAPRPNALASTVAARIELLLPGDVSADAVAAALKMSARTLQRRLEDEGIRFSTILDETRTTVAKRLLADPTLALAEIAYRIGFSDLATFSRAFKRWTGVPPGTFRRRTAGRSLAS